MKKIDMSKFFGVDFDCEYTYDDTELWDLHGPLNEQQFSKTAWYMFRPILNKPQVLDDWSWVPDGLMWRTRACLFVKGYNEGGSYSHATHRTHVVTSRDLRGLIADDQLIEWSECLGLEQGYELEGMEVYDKCK